jgi:hypothetical protein
MSGYSATLAAAWADATAPRAPDAPTVVSLFAGGGGSSLGYAMAGYRELLTVEWDRYAATTFRNIFPDVPIHEGDIAQLSIDEAFRITGLRLGHWMSSTAPRPARASPPVANAYSPIPGTASSPSMSACSRDSNPGCWSWRTWRAS